MFILEDIPWSDVLNFAYAPYFIFAYILFIVSIGILKLIVRKVILKRDLILLSFGIITLGISIGIIMGNNRNPISDTVISSVLSIIGGVIAYLFAKTETSKKDDKASNRIAFESNKATVIIFLTLFPISLLYGANSGSLLRLQNEIGERAIEYNYKLSLDSLELWKRQEEGNLEINKIKVQTWSDNEKKRFEFILNHLAQNDTIPLSPVY